MTRLALALSAAAAAALLGAPGAPSPPMVALEEMVRAVNAGDAHAYAEVYAPDAVLTVQGGDVLRGRSAIEAYEVGLMREFPDARLGLQSIWQRGPMVMVHYAVNGRTTGGQAMGHEGLLFLRFLPSGLIAEERRYLDSLTPMAQLGPLGSVATRALPTVPAEMPGSGISLTSARREQAQIDAVRKILAARDAKDSAGFLVRTTDDVVVDEMIEAQPSGGRHAVAAWLGRWTHAVSGVRTEVVSIACMGDTVLVETVLRGTLDGALGPVSASSKPFTVHRAEVVRFKDGKIAHIRAFMNGKELAQSVGQWPPR